MSNIKNKPLLPLLVILLIPVIVFLVNVPIAAILWQYGFDDGNYSHAYLIPLIYIYLCYHLYKHDLLHFRDSHNASHGVFFAFLFIVSCYVFFVAATAQITLAYLTAHILLIISATMLLFKFNWRLIFPAFYLVFMYTLWAPLVPVLQSASVSAVTFIMGFTGVPIYVEQQFVSIPSGNFEIAGGCSGLRYLITALAISSLYIFLYLNKLKPILLFLSVAIAGALFTNWIRITIIILIGHYTDMTSDLIHDHNMFGWYLFIPFMYLLFKFGNRLELDNEEKQNNTAGVSQTISLPLLTLFFIGITMSSTFLNSLSSAVIQTQNPVIKNEMLYPSINSYSQLSITEEKLNSSTFRHYTYHFNAKNLYTKPTNFNNKLINDSWIKTDEINDPQWNITILNDKKTNKKAITAVSYTIDGQRAGSKNKFKRLRLKKALIGKSNTQLDWIGAICETDCIEEKNVLFNYLK